VAYYARKIPHLVPVAVLVTGGAYAAAGTWIQNTVQSVGLRLLLYVTPFVPALVGLYVADLILIVLSDSPELQSKMKLRWKRFLETGEPPELFGPAEDLPDRAACIVVWCESRRLR
jgi:hypothetical protein